MLLAPLCVFLRAEHILADATDWRAELAPELVTLAGLLDIGDTLYADRVLCVYSHYPLLAPLCVYCLFECTAGHGG